MKRLAWSTFVILATLAVVYLLWAFRTAVILFLLSLIVSAILRPIVNYLTAHKLARGLALGLTYLAVVAFLAGLLVFLSGPLISDLQFLAADLPSGYEQLRAQWLTGSWFQRTIAQSLPDVGHLIATNTSGESTLILQNILGITLSSLDLLSNILFVFVLSVYWTADQEHFKRLWLSLLPSDARSRWREIWQNVEREIGAYLRSELIQSLLIILFLGVGYQLIGIKYPVLLAVIGAIGWLIVWFGGLVAVIPALLVGLAISPFMGIFAALYTISVLSFLEFIVEPKLFNKQGISSLLVVVLVLILAKQYGILGILAAPPIAAAIQIFVRQSIFPTATVTKPVPPPLTVQIDLLHERLTCVQSKIGEQAEPPPPEIANLMERLAHLIEKTNRDEQFSEE
jgi:putative permease